MYHSNSLDLLIYFCGLEGEEYERYCQYHSLVIGWGIEEKDPFKMTNEEKNTLIDIAKSQTRIAGSAQALLLTVFKEEYSNWVEGDTATTRLGREETITGQTLMAVYPNPSSSGASIQFEIPDLSDGTVLKIIVYDILGNEKWKEEGLILESGKAKTMPSLPPGIYTVNAEAEGRTYHSTLIIQ